MNYGFKCEHKACLGLPGHFKINRQIKVNLVKESDCLTFGEGVNQPPVVINRPVVAGAVLQTPSSFIN